MAQVTTFQECKKGRHKVCPGQMPAGKNFGGAVCDCWCHRTREPAQEVAVPPAILQALEEAVEAGEELYIARTKMGAIKVGGRKRTAEQKEADQATIKQWSKAQKTFDQKVLAITRLLRAYSEGRLER